MEGRVAWITIAPVKGLGLVSPAAVEVTRQGVVENRRFHLLDARGRLVNGKRVGPLVRVVPDYDEAAGTLALAFPDGTAVSGDVELGRELAGTFFGEVRAGHIVGGPFSAALSEHAGMELTLVRADVPGTAVDRGHYGAVSLLSSAALNGFDPRRFRMLFGVDGVPAHAEDGWIGRPVRVGGAVVRPQGLTTRCLVTSQNPDSGVADMDMLQHLRDTRPEVAGEPLPFGVHASVVEPGRVAVGDCVIVAA
jgi:uncharacterized protein YcbX